MSGNSIGKKLVLTTFGESHGPCIGGVIDGYPADLNIDYDDIKRELARRKPGQSKLVTPRKEEDKVEFLSGIYKGKTLGTPIAFILKNKDIKSSDYDELKDLYRPSHADYTYSVKYGHRDERGGGRASARETAVRVVAGALAKQFLAKHNIFVNAYVIRIGDVEYEDRDVAHDIVNIEESLVRCPDPKVSEQMIKHIEKVKEEGDSIGGVVKCIVKNVKPGLGSPVFDKLHADLGKAMLSINAVKGFEYGSGFEGSKMKGSEHNDAFEKKNNEVITNTNYSGGIQGGISNGMDIYFNVAFKPTPTIKKEQTTIDKKGNKIKFAGEGRHDPCVVPRAVPVVEAMAAIVMMDHFLRV